MAIDPVSAVHASAATQKIEAVDNAQRNPNPQNQPSTVPRDKVTISAEARSKQAPSALPQTNAPVKTHK